MAGAVAAVGAAEHTQWDAVTGLAFVLTTERLISNVVEGADTRRKADVLADVLGALVRAGRAIRKGEDVPPALIGANDVTLVADYVAQHRSRASDQRPDLPGTRGQNRDRLLEKSQASHGRHLASDFGRCRALRLQLVTDQFGRTLALIERRYAAGRRRKSDRRRGATASKAWSPTRALRPVWPWALTPSACPGTRCRRQCCSASMLTRRTLTCCCRALRSRHCLGQCAGGDREGRVGRDRKRHAVQ